MDKQGQITRFTHFTRFTHARRRPLWVLCCLGLALCLHKGAIADSAQGADTALGNKQNPTGQDPGVGAGAEAIGTFRPGGSRTPTGLRYASPPAYPAPPEAASGWITSLSLEFGFWGGDGNLGNASFRQYADWSNGLALNWFSFGAENPADAMYVDLRASNVGSRDQFYGLEFGRYNDFRVKAFVNQMPHALGDGSSFFQGAGTAYLALPSSLTPAASTLAEISAAADAGAPWAFKVQRDRAGVRADLSLSEHWKAAVSYTFENRKGSRPMGGSMFFPIDLGGTVVGGISEIIEPIDYKTHDLVGQLQYATARTQFNVDLSASLFRNSNAALTWENPFNVASVIGPNPYAANLPYGQMSLAPDNQAYNIKASLSHTVPEWARARFSATVAMGRMTQNEDLLAPSVNTGTGGLSIPGSSWNNADWNTTAALSQQSAQARIDTRLIDLAMSVVPKDGLSVRAKFRHHETDNKSAYTAYNPLTGEYGYLALGGAQGTVVPFEGGIYSPASPLWHYRSIPFDGSQTNVSLEADYSLRRKTTLTASVERETYRRHFRERSRTWDDKVKLSIADRNIGDGTVRASYEYNKRRGSEYNDDPYQQFYTSSLPGAPVTGIPHTLAELRKYDLADRQQQIVNLRFNYPLREDLDAGLNLQAKRIDWGAQFGRVDRQSHGSVNFDLSWTPADGATAYGFFSHERSRIRQANVNDSAANMIGSPNVGGPVYLSQNVWDATSKDRSNVFGMGFKKSFTERLILDASFSMTRSKSSLGYGYVDAAGATLGTPGVDIGDVGNAFPDMSYRLHAFQASLLYRTSKQISWRFVARTERLTLSDWHYSGLTPVIESNTGGLLPVSFVDLGPTNYRASLFGVFVQYAL